MNSRLFKNASDTSASLESRKNTQLKRVSLAVLDTKERQVGSGAVGVVSLGRWHNKQVAIKELNKTQVDNMTSNQDYNEEIQMKVKEEKEILNLLMTPGHPNVLRYYGYGRVIPHPGVKCYFYVSEWMSNGNLYEYISSPNNPLELPSKLKIMCGISDGLKYMHDKGIVNGDVKSTNVFLSNDLTPKLGDLEDSMVEGVSNIIETAGTAPYSPPEVYFFHEMPSKASDMYGMGVILWEVMSWAKPEKALESYKHIQKDIIVSFLSRLIGLTPTLSIDDVEHDPIPENCPPGVAKLITLGWSKHAENRPTINKFKEGLEVELSLLKPR